MLKPVTMRGVEDRLREIEEAVRNNNLQKALDGLIDIVDDYEKDIDPNARRGATKAKARFEFYRLAKVNGDLNRQELNAEWNGIVNVALQLHHIITGQLEQVSEGEPDSSADISFRSISGTLQNAPPPTLRLTGTDQSSGEVTEEHTAQVTLLPQVVPANLDPTEPSLRGQEIVVCAEKIGRRFGRSSFELKPLSFDVSLGEILGVVGVNGSGKSTLLDMLRGARAPEGDGTVTYPYLQERLPPGQSVRSKIGYIDQRPEPWFGSVRENLEYAAAQHGIIGDFNEEWVSRLISRHGLANFENHKWSQLSGGYRLRFELALVRVSRPKLLILDEPLANLDLVSQQDLLHDLKQIASARGSSRAGIVITSQHLYELEAITDRLLVLNAGKRIDTNVKRQFNYFEIGGEFGQRDVETCLRPLQCEVIRMRTTVCFLVLPQDVHKWQVMEKLRTKDIAVTYFRDITDSSRIFLEDDEINPTVRLGAGQ